MQKHDNRAMGRKRQQEQGSAPHPGSRRPGGGNKVPGGGAPFMALASAREQLRRADALRYGARPDSSQIDGQSASDPDEGLNTRMFCQPSRSSFRRAQRRARPQCRTRTRTVPRTTGMSYARAINSTAYRRGEIRCEPIHAVLATGVPAPQFHAWIAGRTERL